jgi:hypothetical protein
MKLYALTTPHLRGLSLLLEANKSVRLRLRCPNRHFAQGLSFAGFARAFGQGADSSARWARKVTEKEDMCGGHMRVGESWWRCVLRSGYSILLKGRIFLGYVVVAGALSSRKSLRACINSFPERL